MLQNTEGAHSTATTMVGEMLPTLDLGYASYAEYVDLWGTSTTTCTRTQVE